MTLRTMGSLGLAAGILGLAALAACDDGSNGTSADAGTPDGAAIDGATPADGGGTDACASGAAAPQPGLTQLLAGDKNGAHIVMALDEGGYPIVAYQRHEGPDFPDSTIIVRRWDPTCRVWSAPFEVDKVSSPTDNGRQLALAFDKSTGTVGVAYGALIGNLTGDYHYEIRYAELKKGAAAFSAPQRVETPQNNELAPSTPGLGMANGKVFVAYREGYRLCNTSGCAAIVFRQRDAAGTWSGESVLPGNGPTGYGEAHEMLSLAVDADGNPGVAWVSDIGVEGTGGVKMRTTFARPLLAADAGGAASIVFENSDTTGTDDPWVELAFDGTKPRAVVIQNKDANYTTTRQTAWYVASDDGSTWKAPVALPHDNGASLDLFASIAIGQNGKIVITVNSNSGDGTNAFGLPKILTSTDGTTFTGSGVPKDVNEGAARWVSSRIGPDGKLQSVFMVPPGGKPQSEGAVYWREP